MSALKIFLLQARSKISLSNFIIFTALILAGFLVRIYGIGEYDFNDDELWHLAVANQDGLWDVIQSNFREEVHPPLSYIILHYMLKISHNDLWLRMSSIIPSLVLIPSSYIFGRIYIGRAAGYFLAFLFAFGAMPISLGVSIRAYPLMMLSVIWAAIFIEKIQREKNTKNFIGYFLCCVTALELNHSAAFVVFSLGLILLFRAFKEKNWKELFFLGGMHAVFGVLVIGYAAILKYFYDFDSAIPGFYGSYGDSLYYFDGYFRLLFWFPIGSEMKDIFAGLFTLFVIISAFATTFLLIRDRKWLLLQLIYLPLIVVITTDVFRIFPFSPVPRNNLFLLFAIVVPYAYFVQIIANWMERFYEEKFFENKKNLLKILQVSFVVGVVVFLTFYVHSHDSFRKTWPGCVEMSISKSDSDLAWKTFERHNSADNVFVTAARNIWYFRFYHGKYEIETITPHLAKFKNDQGEIYFSAFPAREFSTNVDMLEYKLFFTDLFEYLKSKGELHKIKEFTYFDVGLNFDYLAMKFIPQMIPDELLPFSTFEDKMYHKYWKEGYNIGWAMHSKEIIDSVYSRDLSFSCGRQVLFLSFPPKFVEQNFINKEFINGRAFEKERRGL